MKSFATLALAAALPFGALAADTYVLDPVHTLPSFEISHFGYSMQRGRFTRTAGNVVLDLAAKSGSIEVVIDAASIESINEKTNTHLKSEDFFFVEKYPTLTFRSDKLRFDGDKLVGADGNLTIRGVTRPVSLAVKNFTCGPHPFNKKPMCGANATATIKRSDFDLKYGLPGIGDEVTLNIPVEGARP
jgi:polyisoprenoid-binding protein YceI